MQDREIPCIYYEYEGCCKKGREGTFYGSCQTCKKYSAKKHAAPARRNNKRKRVQQLREMDMWNMMNDYD